MTSKNKFKKKYSKRNDRDISPQTSDQKNIEPIIRQKETSDKNKQFVIDFFFFYFTFLHNNSGLCISLYFFVGAHFFQTFLHHPFLSLSYLLSYLFNLPTFFDICSFLSPFHLISPCFYHQLHLCSVLLDQFITLFVSFSLFLSFSSLGYF